MAIFRRYSRHQLAQAVLTMDWRQHNVSAGDLYLHARSLIQTNFLGNRFRDPYSQAVAPFCNPRAQGLPLLSALKIHNGYTPETWLPQDTLGSRPPLPRLRRSLKTAQHPLDREHLALSAGPEFSLE